jgi:hypothetical protein
VGAQYSAVPLRKLERWISSISKARPGRQIGNGIWLIWATPSPDVGSLLAEIDADPTAIFLELNALDK